MTAFPAAGIVAFGAYVPRARLRRAAIHAATGWFAPGLKGLAKGERAIADWDEDPITMAVEACRNTLGDRDRNAVRTLALASTTLPFADRLNAGVVKEALNLNDDVSALDVTGSQRAATTSLIHALRRADQDDYLLVAAEMRKTKAASEAELVLGDGAAAVLIGSENPVATLIGSHTVTADFVDHFRAAGANFDYNWEARWIRDEGFGKLASDTIIEALRRLDVSPSSVDHFVMPTTIRGVAAGLAKRIGIADTAVVDSLGERLGDTGVAHPLMMLASVLERAEPGQRILLVGFGQGVDVLLFETTPALRQVKTRGGVQGALKRGAGTDNYIRWLFHRGALGLDRGMRAELDQKQPGTTLWRDRKTVLGLVGGRCSKTGTVQFPRSAISVNPNDRSVGTQEDYPLAELRARIVTYTADNLTYSPSPPSYYGVVDFEGGGRMTVEFTDADAEDIEVGRAVAMVFRIKAFDEQRGFVKYFWKAIPVPKGTE